MNKKNYLYIIGIIISIWFIFKKCCIYTLIIAYFIFSGIGYDTQYCISEVNNELHYHAWISVNSHIVDPSTLNLYHSPSVNYSDPLIFNSISEFISCVDMLSPIT